MRGLTSPLPGAQGPKPHLRRLLAGAIIALAILLLTLRLGELPRLDLDEGSWTLLAARAAAGIDPGNASNYSLPLLRWWAQAMLPLAGDNLLPALRLLPVFLTLLLLTTALRLVPAWFGQGATVPVLACLALNPFTIVWGRLFRTPYLVIAIINLLIVAVWFRPGGGWRRLWVLPLFLLAGLMHPIGLALAPGLFLLSLWQPLRAGRQAGRAMLTVFLLILLVGGIMAYNLDLVQQRLSVDTLAERWQRASPFKAGERVLTIGLGLVRVLDPSWVLSGLLLAEDCRTLPGGGWLAMFLGLAMIMRALVIPPGNTPRRVLTWLLLSGLGVIVAILFVSSYLNYAWAMEDPQMQRFLIPLAPLLAILLGEGLSGLRPHLRNLLLFALLAAWLTPLAGWLGGSPVITARTQLQFYHILAATLRVQPDLTLYTDDWGTYIWVQALAGESPRVVLLRRPPGGPGYLETFLENLVCYQEQADTYTCTRPGLYLIRSVALCRPLPVFVPETATGRSLVFFRIAADRGTS